MSKMSETLKVSLPGLDLKNPIMPASGCFQYGKRFAKLFDLSELGAIIVKAATLEPRVGNPNPRVVRVTEGLLNSVGLKNPGLDHILADELPFLEQFDVPIIANVAGSEIADYVETAKRISQAPNVQALELNISCPNVKEGGMVFGTNPESARRLTSAVKEVSAVPVYVKLSPNVTSIVEMARSVSDIADGITMINTFVGLQLDKKGRPELGNKIGGVSGRAIKPIALNMAYEVRQALPDIPLIAMGGIATVDDVLDYISVGTDAVAVGTENFNNPYICKELIADLEQEVAKRKLNHLHDLKGRAL